MRGDVDPFNLMKPRKRARETDNPEDSDSDSLLPNPKHYCSRFESSLSSRPPAQRDPSLPTPPSTASPKYDDPNSQPRRARSPTRSKARRPFVRASPQSEPTPAKQPFEQDDDNAAPAPPATKRRRKSSSEYPKIWFLNKWINSTCPTISAEEAAEAVDIIPTVEETEDIDKMSQLQDAESTRAPGSTVSERLKTSSPMYRGVLKMNDIIIDNFGTEIPREVEELVTKHIRKARTSPPLEEEKKASIKRKIQEVWDSPEPTVSDIITAPLFDLTDPALAHGRDILWSPKPLPRSTDYPLVTPKTDRHLGFQPTLKSKWTRVELAAADHPKVRPYSQPTRENLFPSFLFEVKSEATGGTLYGAEGQLATAGFHRVSSLMWILDQTNPNRTRSSCDAIIFSVAVDQREAVVHVHYYNPEDEMFYMSYIESFYFAKDIQACHDHVKNVVDWLLEIQQPIVRDALKAFHPIMQLWKKARSASAVADEANSSFSSDSGRSTKNQRLA